MRSKILALAQHPVSASDIARTLGVPRQRVNYHVQQLAGEGFLKPVAEQRKRNMVEKQYVASATAYVLNPDVLGDVAPQAAAVHDTANAGHLVGICARAQIEVATVMESASVAGVRLRTLSLQSDIRFESVEQRAEFTEALMEAVSEIVARHSATSAGRPFRLILGCYPRP